ncbi:hypothetical protein KDA00_04135 [Candidatus Saccharibacteria bacterium]|nr:hypothetical protein [Candidatus Saccharibacteria bacterium]
MTSLNLETLIEGPDVNVPRPIFPNDFGVESCHEIVDRNGGKYDIFKFGPNQELPEIVAEWLRYRTLTQLAVQAEHEGDIYRFGDVQNIKEKFLHDQGGRTLYVATREGRIYGESWLHGLRNSSVDFLLAQAGIDYFASYKGKEIGSESLATIAVREYGAAIRNGLALELNAFATHKYFEDHPNCLGVVDRLGANDTMQQELNDNIELLFGNHKMIPIKTGPGFIIHVALRHNDKEEQKTDSGFIAETIRV